SPDGLTAILFNGEIYNFREERRRLEGKGFSFKTTTDTEVALALYLENKRSFTNRLRGMFAIAIFDWRDGGRGQTPDLVLARDPLGIKPLYVSGDGFESPLVFASELRAMKASGLIKCEPNHEALFDFLRYGFVIQPRTMLAGVRMFEPGAWERHSGSA